jgi:hypothetical protein
MYILSNKERRLTMNSTENLIAVTLRNTFLHADTYIQDVFHTLSVIDSNITWDEKNKTFTVCGLSVKVGSIDGETGTVVFTIIYSNTQQIGVVCPVIGKEIIMIETLKQQIVDEESRIENLDKNIEMLNRNDAVQHTYVSLYSRTTGLEAETDDMSTDTVQTIIDLVRNDMEVARAEKLQLIDDLNKKLEALTPKKWEWSISTESLWANFDNGVVEAHSYDEAMVKANAILTEKLNEVNDLLGGKYTVYANGSNITLTEIN